MVHHAHANTSGRQLGAAEDHLADIVAIVAIQRVSGRNPSGFGIANDDVEGLAANFVPADGFTSIVVVDVRARIAALRITEVFGIELNLGVLTIHRGVQQHVILNREFVDGVETILDGVGPQQVVVIEALVGAIHNKGAVAVRQRVDVDLSGEFEHVVLDGLIQADADVPNTSSADLVVEEHKLALDKGDTVNGIGRIGHEVHVDAVVVFQVEGHFGFNQAEEVRVGSEVVVTHVDVVARLVVEGPFGRTHPSASRAELHIEGVDLGDAVAIGQEVDVRIELGIETVIPELDLEGVSIRMQIGRRRRIGGIVWHSRSSVVIVILGSVASIVGSKVLGASGSARVVHHGEEQVAHTIIVVTVGQVDGRPAIAASVVALVDQIAGAHSHDSISRNKRLFVSGRQIDGDVTGVTTVVSHESDAHHLTFHTDFVSMDNLLRDTVLTAGVVRDARVVAVNSTNLNEALGGESPLHFRAERVVDASDAGEVKRIGVVAVHAGAVVAHIVHGAVGHNIVHAEPLHTSQTFVGVVVNQDGDVVGAIVVGETTDRDFGPIAGGEINFTTEDESISDCGGIQAFNSPGGHDVGVNGNHVHVDVAGLGSTHVVEAEANDVAAHGVDVGGGVDLLAQAELVVRVQRQIVRNGQILLSQTTKTDHVLANTLVQGREIRVRGVVHGGVSVGIHGLIGAIKSGISTEIGGTFPDTSSVVDNHCKVLHTVVRKGSVEGDGCPLAGGEAHRVAIDKVTSSDCDGLAIFKVCLIRLDQVDLKDAVVAATDGLEAQAGNVASRAQFFNSVNLLRERVVIIGVGRNNRHRKSRVCVVTHLIIRLRLC